MVTGSAVGWQVIRGVTDEVLPCLRVLGRVSSQYPVRSQVEPDLEVATIGKDVPRVVAGPPYLIILPSPQPTGCWQLLKHCTSRAYGRRLYVLVEVVIGTTTSIRTHGA